MSAGCVNLLFPRYIPFHSLECEVMVIPILHPNIFVPLPKEHDKHIPFPDDILGVNFQPFIPLEKSVILIIKRKRFQSTMGIFKVNERPLDRYMRVVFRETSVEDRNTSSIWSEGRYSGYQFSKTFERKLEALQIKNDCSLDTVECQCCRTVEKKRTTYLDLAVGTHARASYWPRFLGHAAVSNTMSFQSEWNICRVETSELIKSVRNGRFGSGRYHTVPKIYAGVKSSC